MLIFFQNKYLRFSTSPDKMPTCQSSLVAAYPKREGGYQWQ